MMEQGQDRDKKILRAIEKLGGKARPKDLKKETGLTNSTLHRGLRSLMKHGEIVRKEVSRKEVFYALSELKNMLITHTKKTVKRKIAHASMDHGKLLVPGFLKISHDYGGKLENLIPSEMVPKNSAYSREYLEMVKSYVDSHLSAYRSARSKVNNAIRLLKKKNELEKSVEEEIKKRIRARFDEKIVPEEVVYNPVELVYTGIKMKLKGYDYKEIERPIDHTSPNYDFLGGRGISLPGFGERVQELLKELKDDEEIVSKVREVKEAEDHYYNAREKADKALSEIISKIASNVPLRGKCRGCTL